MLQKSDEGARMMMNQAKNEEDSVSEQGKLPCSSSSRQWSSYKNPRIVRVSRTFGGKDRHSKVCTVRGLRDRRIRLSVPTAIQLYSLQDRLGLGQPSKVVDWLLDATKHEIDKLPPLPLLPETFTAYHSAAAAASELSTHFLTSYGVKEKENEEGFGMLQQQSNNSTSTSLIPITNFQNPYLHWDLQNGAHFGFNETQNPNQTSLYFCSSEVTSATATPTPSFLLSSSQLSDSGLGGQNHQSVSPTTLHFLRQLNDAQAARPDHHRNP